MTGKHILRSFPLTPQPGGPKMPENPMGVEVSFTNAAKPRTIDFQKEKK
jgi:hypothetical protein